MKDRILRVLASSDRGLDASEISTLLHGDESDDRKVQQVVAILRELAGEGTIEVVSEEVRAA